MLHLLGKPYHNCDKRTRRSFLLAGALGIGGLKLSDLLRAEGLGWNFFQRQVNH